jgi:hypothetical protein
MKERDSILGDYVFDKPTVKKLVKQKPVEKPE